MTARLILSFGMGLLLFSPAKAQALRPISEAPIVNTPSGSRSVNFVDLNDDGYDDVFISNGPKGGADNFCYLTQWDASSGKVQFVALTNDSLVLDHGPSDGATFADVDNDGDLDVYVVNWYGVPNLFYLQEAGRFIKQNGVFADDQTTYSETAAWGDYDNDGWLDLYVTNSEGDKRNLLYHNEGNGAFTKVAQEGWLADDYPSRSVNWVDFDQDGDLDLFVSNENKAPNNLYRNDGEGTFTSLTDSPVCSAGKSSTGSSWADIDNDGDLDLFIANYGQKNQLFFNDGKGNFTEEVADESTTDLTCSFGTSFGDYDNDGDLDLFVVNAFCEAPPNNFLYENDGRGKFTRVKDSPIEVPEGWSYGCAWGDFNADGQLDLVVARCLDDDQANLVFQNQGNGNHWIKVKCVGTSSNRSAIGAKVRVLAKINGQSVWQMREISSQDGYCSQKSLTAHFGLGNATQIEKLVVEFPGGKKVDKENVAMDELLVIVEE